MVEFLTWHKMGSSSNDMVHNVANFATWKYIDKKWLELCAYTLDWGWHFMGSIHSMPFNMPCGVVKLKPPVTEQRVTAQWSYIVSDPNFCNHHWFGCALLSFTIGMHGGYHWRTKEAHCA
jgi:hypothetical protein